MKGLVFTFNRPKNNKTEKKESIFSNFDFKKYTKKASQAHIMQNSNSGKLNKAVMLQYIKKYGVLFVLACVMLIGVIWGSIVAKTASGNFIADIDFLFTTNFKGRLNHNFFQTFCACFASNFIFLAATFICGMSPWGVGTVPLIQCFKGFGIGLCAGFLYSNFGARGVGFYMVVILLGLFIFTVVLLNVGYRALAMSTKIFRTVCLEKQKNYNMKKYITEYYMFSAKMLILSTVAALVDSILWSLLAPLFKLY